MAERKPFDVRGARLDGVPDEDIMSALGRMHNFDVNRAREDGVPSHKILQALFKLEGVPEEDWVRPEAQLGMQEQGMAMGKAFWEGTKQLATEYGSLVKAAALGAPGGEGALPGPRGAKALMGPLNTIDGISHWLMNRGLEENVKAFGADEGIKRTLQTNGLTAATFLLDGITLAKGVPIASALRGVGMKMGLRPGLALIQGTAIEGAGYMGAYEALEGVFEGQAIGEMGKEVAQGMLMGAGFGGALGAGAVPVEKLMSRMGKLAKNRVQMDAAGEVADRQAAAHRAAVSEEAAKIAELAPNLGEDTVIWAAERIVVDGADPGKIMNELVGPPRTEAQLVEHTHGTLKPGEQADFIQMTAAGADVKQQPAGQYDMFAGREDIRMFMDEGNQNIADEFDQALKFAGAADEHRSRIKIEGVEDLTEADIHRVTVKERGKGVPFHGDPKHRTHARAIGEEFTVKETVMTNIEAIGKMVGGFFRSDLGKHNTMLRPVWRGYRVAQHKAKAMAQKTLERRVFSKLLDPEKGVKGALSRSEKYHIISDYAYFLSRAAHFKSDGTKYAKIMHRAMEDQAAKVGEIVKANPDMLQAYQELRTLTDEMWFAMRREGLLEPNQYRDQYSPQHRLFEMAQRLETATQGTKVGKKLKAQLRRGAAGEDYYQQTDLINLLTDSMEALHLKVAEKRAWNQIAANQHINLTRFFKNGEPISKKYMIIRPGEGFLDVGPDGFSKHAGESMAAAAKRDVMGPHDMVVPKEVADKWMQLTGQGFRVPGERQVYAGANFLARQMTVYNPGNLVLNAMSDTPLAMLGMPGEASDIAGFIRFYPTALHQATVGAFEGRAPFGLSKVLGKAPEKLRKAIRETPDFDRAIDEGLTGATFISSIGGETVPHSLSSLQGDAAKLQAALAAIPNAAKRARLAVETTPRLAAGLAAEKRALRAGRTPAQAQAEFGRVGRDITLPFNVDEPALSAVPIARVLAPFWKWNGMAIERMYSLGITPGSRTRTWSTIVGFNAGTNMWNRQNEEFLQVERSLPDYIRRRPHMIAKDPLTGRPIYHENGKPMVLQMRYFVPGEVGAMFGLGNPGADVLDMLQGRLKPTEQAEHMLDQAGETAANLPAPLHMILNFLNDKDKFSGRYRTKQEKWSSIVPSVWQLASAKRDASSMSGQPMVNYLNAYFSRLTGVRATGLGKEGTLQDAQIMGHYWHVKDHLSSMYSKASKGDKAGLEAHKKELLRHLNRMKEVREFIRNNRGENDIVLTDIDNRLISIREDIEMFMGGGGEVTAP
jgi:hypothetical protein